MGLLFEVLSFSMTFFWAYFVCITKPPLGIYIYVGFDPVHFQLQLDPQMILSLLWVFEVPIIHHLLSIFNASQLKSILPLLVIPKKLIWFS